MGESGEGIASSLNSVLGVSLEQLVGLTAVQADGVGLFTGGIALGWFLLAPLFAIRAWRAAASGRGGEVSSLLVRAAVIGLLLTAMPTIQNAAIQTWTEAYAWASQSASRLMRLDGENLGALRENINALAGDADLSAGLAAVMAFASGGADEALQGIGMDSTTVSGAGAVAATSRVAFRWMTRALRMVLIPIMLFFLILLYISAITVLLAVIVLPTVLPLLLTPVGGGLVAGVVTRATAAFGAVVALPLIFAVAVNLGIILPVSRVLADVNEALADTASEYHLIDDRGEGLKAWDVAGRLDVAVDSLTSVFTTLGRFADVIVFGIMGLIVGVLAAIAIIVTINQIFERLLGTIMVSGHGPKLPKPAPSKGGGAAAATAAAGGGATTGGGPGGGPSLRPNVGGSSPSGDTTPLNPPVTQPSAYASRQTQSLNRPVSPDATPDAEV